MMKMDRIKHTVKVDFHGMKAMRKKRFSMNGEALFAGEIANDINLCRRQRLEPVLQQAITGVRTVTG